MEQTKALNALEPFIALSKTTTSPRAATDLITQATSSPTTFIFAELLSQPTITALSSSDEASHRAYHTLLSIFSYGTYEDYKAAADLPPLNEAQTLKLRQLSLLTLARDRRNLSYAALKERLGLGSEREVEDLVITAIYAGLVTATLDPARQAIQVTTLAPLRDLSPNSIPHMAASLKTWSDRCTSTLQDLETQIINIRANAAARAKERRTADEKLAKAKTEFKDLDEKGGAFGKGGPVLRGSGKRLGRFDDASMDVDDPGQEGRGSKRKM